MYGISVLHSRVVRCSFRYNSNSTKKLLEFLAEMPKSNKGRINDIQRQRLNVSNKKDRYPPSNVYLQVLGSGARGVPNTLYLFTDHKRYLFNCGECTQRLAHEHKVKLSKLDHIFITRKSWKNIGGLPGLSLTLQDVGVPNITLHGPEGLDELYSATKRFVIMKEMSVTMAKCSRQEDFVDNALSVKYILLGPHDSLFKENPPAKKPRLEDQDKEFEEFVHDDTDYYRRDTSPNSRRNRMNDKKKGTSPEPSKNKSDKALQNLHKKTNCTLAYVVTLKKRIGTLDLAKCVEFGVKPGPLLGQLKNGQNVVLPDGTLVLSKDVKTPDDPGPVFIVMEVPDISYLKESEFSAHFDNGQNAPENIPALVVHYTPPHVYNDKTYQDFLSKFGTNTQHMVLNSQNSCLGSEAVHRTQHKLHLLDSDIFPMLKDASMPAVWDSHPMPASADSPVRRGLEELKNKIALAQFQNMINLEGSKGDGSVSKEGEESRIEAIAGRTLTMFHLRPPRQLDRSAEPKLHIQKYLQEAMNVDGFVTSLDQFRRLSDTVRKGDSDAEYPKVVFLGTGSCIPSKTRNTSAIALQVDENRSMILDCGEGTFGQLVRFFGTKKVDAFLRTVRAIYVSHLHADHHIGLIGVLQARRAAFLSAGVEPEPVHLLAPGQIYTWLSLYDQQFERIKPDFTLIPNQNLVIGNQNTDLTAAMLASIGVQHIQTCYVSHCPNAFGVAVQVDADHKITYSGDTIPCDALATIGADSTLLIHEATMEDELVEEARTKMHSTTSQAIAMGRRMNAKYTVLTHFSQRYARLPRLNSHILNDNKSVGIAFDNMQIKMNDLDVLPHMYAPLQLMFAEHCLEMELKAVNRAKTKERQEKPSNTSLPGSEYKEIETCNQSFTSPLFPFLGYLASTEQHSSSATLRNVTPSKYRDNSSSKLRLEKIARDTKEQILYFVKRTKNVQSNSSSPARRSANTSPPCSQHSDSFVPCSRNSERTIGSTSSKVIEESITFSDDKKGLQILHSRANKLHGYKTSPVTSHPKPKTPACMKHNQVEKRQPFSLQTKITDWSNHLTLPAKEAISGNALRATSTKIIRRKWTPGRTSTADKIRTYTSPRAPSSHKPSRIPIRDMSANTLKMSSEWVKTSIENLKPFLHSNGKLRCSPNHSTTRSFKSDLEDIKSSYILLNKTRPKNTFENETLIQKSIDETQRKKMLVDVKKKFLTKEFKIASRFEKIEGLNWISWK